MLSKTEIANLTLGRLGSASFILNFDNDQSTPARVMRRHFNTSLKTILRKHQWNFATGYAALTLISLEPNNTWAFEYGVPDDLLVIRELGIDGVFNKLDIYEDEKNRWEEVASDVGHRIYTDLGDAEVKYTKDMLTATHFPEHVGRAVSAQMALDIAPAIITNNFSKVQTLLLSGVRSAISEGIADDVGDQPQKETSDSPYVRARL